MTYLLPWWVKLLRPDPNPMLTKYDAPCCAAKVDKLGRWPVGYCGPRCERRSGRYAK